MLPINSEKNLQLQIDNILFLDSFQFLSSSLDTLVATLAKSGKHNFRHISRFLGDDDFLFQKIVFCYGHMTNRTKFEETALPLKEKFYNEDISNENYERACHVLTRYDMRNLRQYHDFY